LDLDHKRAFSTILAQCRLPGAKPTLGSNLD
jgi:hypothetical protein